MGWRQLCWICLKFFLHSFQAMRNNIQHKIIGHIPLTLFVQLFLPPPQEVYQGIPVQGPVPYEPVACKTLDQSLKFSA